MKYLISYIDFGNNPKENIKIEVEGDNELDVAKKFLIDTYEADKAEYTIWLNQFKDWTEFQQILMDYDQLISVTKI